MLSLQSTLIILTWLCTTKITGAVPKFLMKPGEERMCVEVEGPMDTILMVRYDAPDLVVDKTDENYDPTYIHVGLLPSRRGDIDSRFENRTKELLTEKEGVIPHKMERDGIAKICIEAQSKYSLRKAPLMFGLFIDRDDSERYGSDALLTEGGVDSHLSYMEVEMQRITTSMKRLISDTDYEKKNDAEIHKHYKSMHSATVFWPIVKVCVLLMTGFTQASHITNFFKTRRIV